ncbi:MAG TPA: hypothetical protein VFV54_05890, partial [Thermoanaerobaculia bacterium]|nr:hypothetical protein [Thermoanaerobaculia bacterium]
ARPPGVQIAANDPRLNGQPITLPPPQPPNPAPPRQPSIGDVEGQVATTAVACGPPPEPIEYRYREATPCGGAGFNFQPYVTRAERRAGAGCRAIACAAGCTPCTPPVNLRSRWRCRNPNEVEVTVHVQCCK